MPVKHTSKLNDGLQFLSGQRFDTTFVFLATS